MSSNFTFPSPIGGVPFQGDFAPSIVFAVIYGLLIPVVAYRLALKRSRTLALIGTFAFAVERVAIFALRAEQSRNSQKRVSDSLTRYMQSSWAVGYISIARDLIHILRCLLVNATLSKNSIKYGAILGSDSTNSFLLDEKVAPASASVDETSFEGAERKEERTRYRKICGILDLFFWVPFIMGTVSGILYPKAEHSASEAQMVQTLRYLSTSIAFLFVLITQGLSVYAAYAVRNIDKRPTLLIVALAVLVNIVAVYRLVVMRLQTTSLISQAPGSLNGTESHVLFYILHIAPEFLAAAVLLGINAREYFGTGLFGDLKFGKKKQKTAEGGQ